MNAKPTIHAYNASDTRSPIARLNDAFRQLPVDGRLAVTAGVIALGQGAVSDILLAVASFDAFTPDNDPYDEHDFGAVEWNGSRMFWKIDCYDRTMRFGSPDPADPSVTTRVLTIMLASEY
jgi:hypothetical protein